MSFLNGLQSFAAGLGTAAANAAKDQEAARAGAINAPDAPAAPDVPDEAAAPAPAPAAAPDPAAAPSKTGGAVANVPPELLPIYQAAAKRTGIPVDVLVAQGKQESGFNPNAVSPTGAVGIAQILPSTAADPGYGLKPLPAASLRDPTASINFQADYMRARAGIGADFSNPGTVDAALRTYNGNSDPNYVASIRRHMAGS